MSNNVSYIKTKKNPYQRMRSFSKISSKCINKNSSEYHQSILNQASESSQQYAQVQQTLEETTKYQKQSIQNFMHHFDWIRENQRLNQHGKTLEVQIETLLKNVDSKNNKNKAQNVSIELGKHTFNSSSTSKLSSQIDSILYEMSGDALKLQNEAKELEKIYLELKSCYSCIKNSSNSQHNNSSNDLYTTKTDNTFPETNQDHSSRSKYPIHEFNEISYRSKASFYANKLLHWNEYHLNSQCKLEEEYLTAYQSYHPLLSGILNQTENIHRGKQSFRNSWDLLPSQVKQAFERLLSICESPICAPDDISRTNSPKIGKENEKNDVFINLDQPEIRAVFENIVFVYQNLQKDYEDVMNKIEKEYLNHILSLEDRFLSRAFNSDKCYNSVIVKKIYSNRTGGWRVHDHDRFVKIVKQFYPLSMGSSNLAIQSNSIEKRTRMMDQMEKEFLSSKSYLVNNERESHTFTMKDMLNHWVWYEKTFYYKQKRNNAKKSLERKRCSPNVLSKCIQNIHMLERDLLSKSESSVIENIANTLQRERQSHLKIMRLAREETAKMIAEKKAREENIQKELRAEEEMKRKIDLNWKRERVEAYKENLLKHKLEIRKKENERIEKEKLVRKKDIERNKDR